MKKDFYSEFVIKNKEHLKDLASASWWKFEQDSGPWLVRGFCNVEGSPRYSLLMTDFSRAFFSTAGPSQIQKEAQEFNPIVLGGVAGVLPLLQTAISTFDENSKYFVSNQGKLFEIQAVIKGIFQFKWVFTLEKLKKTVSRRVLEKMIFLPLVNSLVLQDTALKLLEEQTRKRPEFELKLLQNMNCGQVISLQSQTFVNTSIVAAIQAEESKAPKKVAKLEDPVALKRKPSPPTEKNKGKPSEKAKNELEYVESQEEAKRKQAIQTKLTKKKEKSKLDFL